MNYSIDEIIDVVNQNKELTDKLRSYIIENGNSLDAICGLAVGMADYYLSLLQPDDCGYDAFNRFWIEPFEFEEIDVLSDIKQAVEKAKEEIDSRQSDNVHPQLPDCQEDL